VAISAQDLLHLRACVALAREALEAGDDPFGSILVDASGAVLRADRNRAGSGDETQWRASWGLPPGPVAVLPITTVAPELPVDGPAPELEEELQALHRAAYERGAGS
jgi:hypothetical protein